MKQLVVAISLLLTIVTANAQHARFHNQETDTVTINRLLDLAVRIPDANRRIETIAKEFIGTPYVANTLDVDTVEILTVNLDQLDCTTFVDNILATAITAGQNRRSWLDFLYTLQDLRYRNGKINGYPSRLHYISDWAVDNAHRGNIVEVTGQTPLASYEVKTIDFMSKNANKYPALSNPTTLSTLKEYETSYRNHRYPVIKTKNVAKAIKTFLQPGDIIAFTTSVKGLDVSHLAVYTVNNGTPTFIHASSRKGEVVIEPQSLLEYLSKNHTLTGIRVFRIKE